MGRGRNGPLQHKLVNGGFGLGVAGRVGGVMLSVVMTLVTVATGTRICMNKAFKMNSSGIRARKARIGGAAFGVLPRINCRLGRS